MQQLSFDISQQSRRRTPAQRVIPSLSEYSLMRAKQRLIIIIILFAAVFSILCGRIVYLTVHDDTTGETPPGSSISNLAPQSTASKNGHRANIVDRNGVVLATSVIMHSLCIDGKSVNNKSEAMQALVKALPDVPAQRIKDAIYGTHRCAVVRRQLTPREVQTINDLGIAGVEFQPEEARLWPLGNITAHVVGSVDIDNKGIGGLEKGLDSRLKQNSASIETSLDVRLQAIVHESLTQAINKFRAKGGFGVVMDATTGEIMALVSLPDYNPQIAGAVANAIKDRRYNNHATSDVYEMGSVFKLFTIAGGIEAALTTPSEMIDVSKPIPVGNKSIRDFHPIYKPINVAQIITESSNIGASIIALRLGAYRQRSLLQKLDMLERPNLEIPETGAPLVPRPDNWSRVTTMTVSFGHGMAVSAIQLVAAVSAIVNGGYRITPTFLKREAVQGDGNRQQIITERTSAIMRAMMRLVVSKGTASAANVNGYLIGGKTGTANKPSAGSYSENERVSSFIGAFPINKPRWVVFAVLDDPKPTKETHGFATGGWTAAPVVGEIIGRLAVIMGIPPQTPDVLAEDEAALLAKLGEETLKAFGE